MKTPPGFSQKIIRIYLLGASILLAFYGFAFHAGVLVTENTVMERRISIVAPHHFKLFEGGVKGLVSIDPLLTLYDSHSLLPAHIRSKLPPSWTGSRHVLLDDETEFQVVAKSLDLDGEPRIVYAVENSNTVEWNDTGFVFIEIILILIGVLLFLVSTAYMIKAAKRLALPYNQVAESLKKESLSNFEHLAPNGEITMELAQILDALNSYRERLSIQTAREQSFTRYVSHELRTPMMIITGSVSNLRRKCPKEAQKPIEKIQIATEQMQRLTETFLELARESSSDDEQTLVDSNFIVNASSPFDEVACSNNVDFSWQLQSAFSLSCHSQLMTVVLQNLLKNAIACSENGRVTLLVNEYQIEVIDDGLGLETKPRGYEGFGIGLVLVRDICRKYNWQFSLENNLGKGCTAKVVFGSLELA